MSRAGCVEVAVFAPIRHALTYLPPPDASPARLVPGVRVRVPLGRRERYGVIVAADTARPARVEALRTISAVVDEEPIVPAPLLALARWAAQYYFHPLGEVLAAVLPGELRRGRPLRPPSPVASASVPPAPFLDLNEEQAAALERLADGGPGFAAFLLNGVTGSGKTEVYLHAARDATLAGRQVLVLVPEIALTGQIVQRFEARFGGAVTVVHSGLTERERAIAWARCQRGQARVVVGTRSAVWTPLPALGLVIVDEEHDASFKQQDGFRYSARDVAVMRARDAGCRVILGSATPSLESCHNVATGKYRELRLATRAGRAAPPRIEGIDVRGLPLEGGLSAPLLDAIRANAARGEQTLLFLNRRGYAPVVLCHACGYVASCPRCDARLVLHKARGRLLCHHCGGSHAPDAPLPGHACEPGRTELVSLGLGTEQLEETLRERFPDLRIARIDRDSMSRRGELERTLAAVRAREIDVLLGTQLLAKGHDFAGLTLVAVVDADSRLFATDFRAEERFAQLLLQVAGRAGRADAPGRVLVQTHQPAHPVFAAVLAGDYDAFARRALAERAAARLPPHAALAVLRAEATAREHPERFLGEAARALRAQASGVTVQGPVPAPMERRAGRFRANLLVSAPTRPPLAAALRALLASIETLPARRRVRWHLDVDPQDAV